MNKKAFTLIELLIVIAIIGILAGVVLVSTNGARTKSRDAVRLSDMKQIQTALDMYYLSNGFYPAPNSSNGSWETSNEDGGDFMDRLIQYESYFSNVPVDPSNSSSDYYAYYRYGAGSSNCDLARGAFYVLGIKNMESSATRPAPGSPGWSCPARDWASEFDWVVGKFEN